MDSADDWVKLTDPKERRRIQNRINQRAHRQRKRTEKLPPTESPVQSTPSSSSDASQYDDTALVPRRNATETCNLLPPQAKQILELFTQSAYQSYLHGCPSADHLLTLSKVNVFQAFWHIFTVMGMSEPWMHEDALSPFSTLHPGYIDSQSLPLSLQPTALQRTQSHHPWLDCFPLPTLRDNLLRAVDHFDEDQLCLDIMAFWDPSIENCSLLVWGEPTDPKSWEVTESFLRKWPWVIRGCPELIQSTNYWRRQRGEKMIFRYV